MTITILIMLIAALIIYFSSELFVNGVEWFGKAFNIAQNAVGTILAAFGTALPESVVTFIAVVFGTSSSQKDIGVGAALGGPLVLSTLAYAIVGISIILFSGKRKSGNCINVNSTRLARDQVWFMGIFAFKVLLGLVAFSIKPWLGFLFLAAYALYFYREISAETETSEDELEPLKFCPKLKNPPKSMIIIQTLFALILIFVGSQLFVHNLESLSISLGMSPHLVSLLLSPIATELPEILNALIWVRQGKENLALANISGSMMIQATVPSALGIFFTPWLFDKPLILSAVITFIAIISIWINLKRHCVSAKKLSINAIFYVVFIVGIIIIKG
jgi:cation:H+ antiporter